MKLRMQLISLVLAMVALAACGHGDISKVKDAKVVGNSTYTNGQALNDRGVCKSIDWSHTKDDHGRSMVIYACELMDGAPPIRAEAAKYEDYLKRNYDQKVVGYDQVTERMTKTLAHDQDLAAKARDASVSDQMFAEAADLGTQWDPEALARKRQQLALTFEENASHAQTNLDEWTAGREKQLGEFAQARDAGLRLTRALTQTTKVTETFEWAIDPDGNPVIMSGAIQVLDTDGREISSWSYPAPYSNIADAVSSKATNFRQYVGDSILEALIVAR